MGRQTPEVGDTTYYLAIIFAENCIKMKEVGPGALVLGAPFGSTLINLIKCGSPQPQIQIIVSDSDLDTCDS